MDMSLRNMYMDAIDLANKYNDLPWEARRLIFQVVEGMIEKKADASIRQEYENLDITVDNVILGGENAESISEN